jgi:hypothetical protein
LEKAKNTMIMGFFYRAYTNDIPVLLLGSSVV